MVNNQRNINVSVRSYNDAISVSSNNNKSAIFVDNSKAKYFAEKAAISETNAAASASTASSKATDATTQAVIALSKASEASASANLAAISETNAAASASTASSKATDATTQASIALAKANEASSLANLAVQSATNAAASASTAATKADIATAQAALAKQYAEETHGQSDVMIENVRAIPAYTNYDYTQTETKGLADLKTWNRSTFDRSKFTVVGSPVITDDGIASGFSTNNYITCNSFDTTAQNYIIEGNFTTSILTSEIEIIFSEGENSSWYENGLTLRKTTSNRLQFKVDNGTNNAFFINSTKQLEANTKYYFKVVHWPNTYKLLVSKGNKTDYEEWATGSSTVMRGSEAVNISFGVYTRLGSAYQPFLGTIDLKQFSITVDGVEVFNGNKTGVDQIKKDDYAKAGDVVVSDDGIASGFDVNGYISTGYTVDLTKTNQEFEFCIKTANENPTGINKWIASATNRTFGLNFNVNNKLDFSYNLTGGTTYTKTITYPTVLKANTTYFAKISTKFNSVRLYVREENEDYGNFVEGELPTSMANNQVIYLGYHFPSSAAGFTGSIDLNTIKFYVNDQLVYQPTLRIPYTLSKTGEKIVDATYRDRVQDMYEQFGWANYYTLLENRKPNYQVVGSPTIDDDYVASGFSSSNKLFTPLINVEDKDFEIYLGKIKSPVSFTSTQQLTGSSYVTKNFTLAFSSQGKFYVSSGSNNFGTFYSESILPNTDYYVKGGIKNGKPYIKYSTNNVDWILKEGSDLTTQYTEIALSIGASGDGSNPFSGSIPLAQFKIYADNALVYEALTEPNFTIPMGENLNGHVTKVDWYRNGITSWEYDTNLDCIETGSCTSGTAVTLPKPMANDNYSLSVPYSAKTAAGFTPSASGDYIAKGKITLG